MPSRVNGWPLMIQFEIANATLFLIKLRPMDSSPGNSDNEHDQVHRCQQGDPAALVDLRETHHPILFNILRARGASLNETEELLADLWGDCVPTADEQASLLDKFSGKCPVQGWLATVATRRWIDLKRKQNRRGDNVQSENNHASIESFPVAVSPGREDVLVDLLCNSLRTAFAACPPADLLMLRLVYLHGLSQREIMRMWNWSESKVSRKLSQAMQRIEQDTLLNLKRKDPWLELTWQDFVDLCETHRIEFL
jgi:RNA polymerase sigma factor (sigma-70 family)